MDSNEQNGIITDISYRTYTDLPHTFTKNSHVVSPKPEEIELRSLLSEWKLDVLAEEFIGKFFILLRLRE